MSVFSVCLSNHFELPYNSAFKSCYMFPLTQTNYFYDLQGLEENWKKLKCREAFKLESDPRWSVKRILEDLRNGTLLSRPSREGCGSSPRERRPRCFQGQGGRKPRVRSYYTSSTCLYLKNTKNGNRGSHIFCCIFKIANPILVMLTKAISDERTSI